MSENPIAISKLNEFIFCPASIYFHSLEEDENKLLYQDSFQLNGTDAHKNPILQHTQLVRVCCRGLLFNCDIVFVKFLLKSILLIVNNHNSRE